MHSWGGTLLSTHYLDLSLNDIDVNFGGTGGETNTGGCVSDLFTGRDTADSTNREYPAGDKKEHCKTEFATANFNVVPNVGVPLVGLEELRDRASSGGNS